jgi:hypothetical protein
MLPPSSLFPGQTSRARRTHRATQIETRPPGAAGYRGRVLDGLSADQDEALDDFREQLRQHGEL